jgi:hypothetical protein
MNLIESPKMGEDDSNFDTRLLFTTADPCDYFFDEASPKVQQD